MNTSPTLSCSLLDKLLISNGLVIMGLDQDPVVSVGRTNEELHKQKPKSGLVKGKRDFARSKAALPIPISAALDKGSLITATSDKIYPHMLIGPQAFLNFVLRLMESSFLVQIQISIWAISLDGLTMKMSEVIMEETQAFTVWKLLCPLVLMSVDLGYLPLINPAWGLKKELWWKLHSKLGV